MIPALLYSGALHFSVPRDMEFRITLSDLTEPNSHNMGKWIKRKLWMTIQANMDYKMAGDPPEYNTKPKQQGSNDVCQELA